MALGDATIYSQGYQKLLNDIMSRGAGAGWDMNKTTSTLGQMGDQFQGMFQNSVGRQATPEEMSSMFSNLGGQVLDSPAGFGGTNYADYQNLFNPYIQNTYGDAIVKSQQDKQTQELQKGEQSINDIVNKVMGNVSTQLSDPLSSAYQKLSGNMNNMGISPSSGAFQAGVGSTVANAGLEAANSGLQAFGLPQIQNIANTASAPYQASLQNMYPGLSSYGTKNNNIQDFQLQSQLAQMLAEQSKPSGFEKGLGYANGISSVLGNMGSAAGPASTMTSYICFAMIERGLLQPWQLDELHYHIMPAMWKKGRAFWNYANNGQELVRRANEAGIIWSDYVDLFYTRVMDEQDPVKAVDLYAEATKFLCKRVAPDLWDERVMRTSLIDSLPFIPLLFTYKPFLETMVKVLRMKMMMVYDNPLSKLRKL